VPVASVPAASVPAGITPAGGSAAVALACLASCLAEAFRFDDSDRFDGSEKVPLSKIATV
jgi:hypothetical protein